MKKLLVILVVIGVIAASLISYGIKIVNRAIVLDEGSAAKWAQVENQYQRRLDLIPNLIEIVKGYTKHEHGTLIDVVQARAEATKMQVNVNDPASIQKYITSQNELGGILGRLIAISEAYPELKANENFLALQNELEATENRVAVARQDYINYIASYNIMLRVFPSGWIIRHFSSLEPRATFSTSEEAKSAPKVQF